MPRFLIQLLLTALVVTLIGVGVRPVGERTELLPATIASSDRGTLMPTVTVTAPLPAHETASDADLMSRASASIAGSVTAGVRRVSLGMPYYTFGRARTSD